MASSHRVAVIRQVTNALRKTFDADYPDQMFRVVYTGPNFQMKRASYPAVYVAYGETSIQNIGLGHRVAGFDAQGQDRLFKQAIAAGTIQFTVMALTPLERDTLMDDLMDVFMFGKEQPAKSAFWTEIFGEDFIWLTLNVENIIPGGVSTMVVPWQTENDILFTGSYALTSSCEFFSDANTSDFVPINKIKGLPYRPDQQVPTGAVDPAPWNPAPSL